MHVLWPSAILFSFQLLFPENATNEVDVMIAHNRLIEINGKVKFPSHLRPVDLLVCVWCSGILQGDGGVA